MDSQSRFPASAVMTSPVKRADAFALARFDDVGEGAGAEVIDGDDLAIGLALEEAGDEV